MRELQILARLVSNAKTLLLNKNSIVVEQFNGLVPKYVGGKRINFSSGSSYESRFYAAVIQQNTYRQNHQLSETLYTQIIVIATFQQWRSNGQKNEFTIAKTSSNGNQKLSVVRTRTMAKNVNRRI